jgi:hypothetical protein
VRLARRFVGWLTNFIHNRNAVHINMLRGWSTSTFSNAVSRDLVKAIGERLKGRGAKPAVRGFLLDAAVQSGKRRRLTMKGSGDIAYTSNTRNTTVITTNEIRHLRATIEDHVRALNLIVPHQVPDQLKKLTAGVRINGRPWKTGDMCYFYILTDRTIAARVRTGKVLFFVVDNIAGRDHLFVCLDERIEVDKVGSIVVFDVHQPPRQRIFHIEHVTHLVATLPFWYTGRPDIRCGVPICTTV